MSWGRQTILFGLGAAALSLVFCGTGIREDELECEQAVAHLIDCCPDFPAYSVKCEYTSDGCTVIDTALSISESQCIEKESCADVRSSGLCEKVPNVAQPTFQIGSDDTRDARAPVCP